MADNTPQNGTANVAADEVSHSGDTVQVQIVQLGTVTGSEGSKTLTKLGAVLSESDFDTKIGSLTETAPSTDTGSSGLNGRLQRLTQHLTSLLARLPLVLGTGGGLKVDGSGTALPVSGTVTANAGTGTLATSVADNSHVTIGAKADAKSTATDTTSISVVQILKQISFSIQAAAASVAGTLTVATHAVTQSGAWTILTKTSETAVSAAVGSGNTIGTAVDQRGYSTAALLIPNTFDGTVINFEVSSDNATWYDLYDINGERVKITTAASRAAYVPAEVTQASFWRVECVTTQATTSTDFIAMLKS